MVLVLLIDPGMTVYWKAESCLQKLGSKAEFPNLMNPTSLNLTKGCSEVGLRVRVLVYLL